MHTARRLLEDEQAQENRVTSSLAGLAVVLSVVVASLFLIHQLQEKAAVEDCLMAQRLNCDAALQHHRQP